MMERRKRNRLAGARELKAHILEQNGDLHGIWTVGGGGDHIRNGFIDALNRWETWGNYNLTVKYFDEMIIVCRCVFTIQRQCNLP